MRKFATIVVLTLVSAGVAGGPAPSAQAAGVSYTFQAATGGTQVKVLDGTAQSDLSAQSSVSGVKSSESSNSTAAVNVEKLVSTGAIETVTKAAVEPAGTTLNSFARTTGVNLLNGLITANVVTTNVSTVGHTDGTSSPTGGTQLAGIHIVGVDLPVEIPENFVVRIPGVAAISLNFRQHSDTDEGVYSVGWAIGVRLLEARAGYSAGVRVLVNPFVHALAEVGSQAGAQLGGSAYGTRVRADAGDGIQVVSGPTARLGTPIFSSKGKTLENRVLGVNVPGLLTTDAVISTSTSRKDDLGNATINNTNEIAHLNVLGGLIRADALKVVAWGKVQDGVWTSRMRMTFVDLVIAGNQIPIDVSRNTIINVAGLGQVAINEQRRNTGGGAFQNQINGIRITLSTERAGLPVGAVIEIGVATTVILP